MANASIQDADASSSKPWSEVRLLSYQSWPSFSERDSSARFGPQQTAADRKDKLALRVCMLLLRHVQLLKGALAMTFKLVPNFPSGIHRDPITKRPRNAKESTCTESIPILLTPKAIAFRLFGVLCLNDPVLAELDPLPTANSRISPWPIDSNIDDPDKPLRFTSRTIV